MADYTSTHTGESIDSAVDIIQQNTFPSVVYGVTPPDNTSENTLITSGWFNKMITQAQSYQHPIGYIFEWSGNGLTNAPDLTTPEKVAQYFGYGTWELFGVGRVVVGLDSNDTTFASDGATGGSKDAIVVSHTHTQASHNHGMGNLWSNGSGSNSAYTMSSSRKLMTRNTTSVTPTINSTGQSGANKNLQPYIVVYRYRRIA